MKQKGFAPVVILVLITLGIFFIPIPSVIKENVDCFPCPPNTEASQCPKCPQKGDVEWTPSIFQRIAGKLSKPGWLMEIVNPRPSPSSVTPEKTPQPSDPTANWKTYTNLKYGYAFKYPESWEPNRGPGNISDKGLSTQRDVDFYDPSLPGEDPGTGLNVMVNELDAAGTKRNCSNLDDCFSKTFDWLTETYTLNKTSSTFVGQPATTFTYQRKTDLYTQSWKYLYFLYKGNAYNIHISTNTNREKVIFGVFDQILSTFKFLEATPSSTPSATP